MWKISVRDSRKSKPLADFYTKWYINQHDCIYTTDIIGLKGSCKDTTERIFLDFDRRFETTQKRGREYVCINCLNFVTRDMFIYITIERVKNPLIKEFK